jgi:alpha-glucosidase
VRSLPKFNYRSTALRNIMYAGPEAVFRRWLRPPYAIDGWRVDVANMLARQGAEQLGFEVGHGIRDAVKSENSQAYLLGENFFDATPHGTPQLQGDLWDATMNYAGFSMPIWYWLRGFEINQHGEPHQAASNIPWTSQALVDTWRAFRAAIPWTIARQQFNLLGSHDTPRILSVVDGDAALNRLAAGLLLTYVGVPSIYYGDEVGLAGRGSQIRACMPWDSGSWDHDLRAFYQTLIQFRQSSTALTEGGFQVLLVEANTLAYLRDSDQEQVVVIAHRGPGMRPSGGIPVAHGALPNGAELVELFSRRKAVVENGYLSPGAISPGIQVWCTG